MYAHLVKAIRKLISEDDWSVEISHVYYEVNTFVDKLAKHGHSLPISVVIFDRVPFFISLDYFADSFGYCRPQTMYV